MQCNRQDRFSIAAIMMGIKGFRRLKSVFANRIER